jgi:transcription termination factor Rho
MKTEDIKLQLQILFQDLASNCNDEWVSKAKCKKDAKDAYKKALRLVEEMYSSITMVDIITEYGRGYSKVCADGRQFKLSLRDDGRTLKLFEVED